MLTHSFRILILTALCNICYGMSDKNWQNVDQYSHSHLGIPYLFSSVHDPIGFDKGISFDANSTDCMNFVMMSFALSSNDPKQWYSNWLALRYTASLDFWGRNHFTSIDFNPALAQYFNAHDASHLFPENMVRSKKFMVHKGRWFVDQYNNFCSKTNCTENDFRLFLKAIKMPPYSTTLTYIPYDKIIDSNGEIRKDFISHLPNIVLIEYVRESWPVGSIHGVFIPVSHMGFLVKKGERLIFRHAKYGATTVEESFSGYIKRIHLKDDPTHLGIHIIH